MESQDEEAEKARTAQRIHLEKVKYLYEKWHENRRLYTEQLKTGKNYGIYFCKTKQRHPKFSDFTPLNVEKYLRDWERENGNSN